MGEREKRLLLFLGNSADLHVITVRKHQGCKAHRTAAPPPSSSYGLCSWQGLQGYPEMTEITLSLDGISFHHHPANSSALFPAQWSSPSHPAALLGNMRSDHQGSLQSHHPLQLLLSAHKWQSSPGTKCVPILMQAGVLLSSVSSVKLQITLSQARIRLSGQGAIGKQAAL